MRRYTRDHEWLEIDGDIATIGVTDYAQRQLGDVVFVELPSEGDQFKAGDSFATVESVKAANDVFAPLDGEVVDCNHALEDEPGLVNSDAEEDGWFVKLRLTDETQLEELMTLKAYKEFCDAENA